MKHRILGFLFSTLSPFKADKIDYAQHCEAYLPFVSETLLVRSTVVITHDAGKRPK